MYFNFTCFLMPSTDPTIVAQGGILPQSGVTQTIVSTTSESQTRQHAMHIADGHADTRNIISSESSLLPHADLQSILSSSVTPQLNSLSIASADSEQERYQLCQTTAAGHDLAHIHLDARKRQEQGNGTATRVQGITCNSNTEVQCAGKRGSVSNAAGTDQEDSGSDFEVNLKVLAVLSIRTETFHSSRNCGCSPWLVRLVSESRFRPFMTTVKNRNKNKQKKKDAFKLTFLTLNYFYPCFELQVVISPLSVFSHQNRGSRPFFAVIIIFYCI